MQNIANEEMAAAWNGVSGRAWVDEQQLLDHAYAPIEKMLVDQVAAAGARAVLDIGCGAGATTLAVARTLGARGQATGVDISDPLIAVARARAQREGLPARFIRADAQTHTFEPAIVRPDDFTLRRDVLRRSGGRVRQSARAATETGRCGSWCFARSAENPFMTTAERAAAPLLTGLRRASPTLPVNSHSRMPRM